MEIVMVDTPAGAVLIRPRLNSSCRAAAARLSPILPPPTGRRRHTSLGRRDRREAAELSILSVVRVEEPRPEKTIVSSTVAH
jgi:hypothetical protein